MIDTTPKLAEFLANCISREGQTRICAIDTEADSLHRYKDSLCLIQFTMGGESVLIDPLAIQDLKPLSDYLKKATVWMHGADYDMSMLKREFGEIPPVVYDTQIGARLLGVKQFGLGNLVEHYFGIVLSKTSQKADWGKRPLSEKMIDYALNDVAYLLEMGDKIVSQLKEKGRYEWFLESCEVARQKVVEREESRDDLWRVSGSGKLDRYGLACLKTLWTWRDVEAEIWDKPSFMVATNRDLLEWAFLLAEGKMPDFPKHYRKDRIMRLKPALAGIKNIAKEDWPLRVELKRRNKDRLFDQRVDEWIALRNKVSTEHDIDGSLIISRSVIEAIAANEIQPKDALMKWQIELLSCADN